MSKNDAVTKAQQSRPTRAVVASSATTPAAASGGNADTVDLLHAAATAVAGRLLALDGDGLWPSSTIPVGDGLTDAGTTVEVLADNGISVGPAGVSVVAGDGISVDAGGVNVVAGFGIVVATDVAVDVAEDFTWTGGHTFQDAVTIQATATVRNLFPELTDAYDLGSQTKMFRKAYVSEIDAVIFAEQTVSLIGGWFVVGHDQGALAADVVAADTTIDFGDGMTPGDFVLMRAALKVEYIQVGTLVSGTTYNVTRNLDGTGANDWAAGTPYLVLGASGDGRIELSAYDEPRISIMLQGATYNDIDEVVRIGNLDGVFGISSTLYGIGIGDYGAGNYLCYDPTNGLQLVAGNNTVLLDGDGLALLYGSNIEWLYDDTGGIVIGRDLVRLMWLHNHTTTGYSWLEDVGLDVIATGRDETYPEASTSLQARKWTGAGEWSLFYAVSVSSDAGIKLLHWELPMPGSGVTTELVTATLDEVTIGVDLVVEQDATFSGLVNHQKFNYELKTSGTGTAQNWLICTLPVSGTGTLDHVVIRAVYGAWLSSDKTLVTILAGNRGAFSHWQSSLGATPGSYARLRAYLNADGSVSFYVHFPASGYSACNYSIECAQADVVIEATPTNVGATPPGAIQYTW